MELGIVKLIVLIILFIGTYIFSLLPVPLMKAALAAGNTTRRKRIEKCISFLSCFAAGVFLGTCLLDLYPGVQSKLLSAINVYLTEESKFRCYPFGEAVMVAGFFLVLIVEQVVLSIKESRSADYEQMENSPDNEHNETRGRSDSKSKRVTYDSMKCESGNQGETQRVSEESYNLDDYLPRQDSNSITCARNISGIVDRPLKSDMDQHEESMHQDPNSHSSFKSFMMLAALSLHSVFEGLAVGLQETEESVFSIFGALVLHKCIIAFSIGLNFVQSKLSLKVIFTSNAVFCIASPIGIALGILINNFNTDTVSSDLVNGILQGLACGTFLYVTFFEVLPHEFNKPKDRILKLVFVIIGFAVVNGVLFVKIHLSGCD